MRVDMTTVMSPLKVVADSDRSFCVLSTMPQKYLYWPAIAEQAIIEELGIFPRNVLRTFEDGAIEGHARDEHGAAFAVLGNDRVLHPRLGHHRHPVRAVEARALVVRLDLDLWRASRRDLHASGTTRTYDVAARARGGVGGAPLVGPLVGLGEVVGDVEDEIARADDTDRDRHVLATRRVLHREQVVAAKRKSSGRKRYNELEGAKLTASLGIAAGRCRAGRARA